MVILAVTILGSYWPSVTLIATLAMYLFILGVFVDGYLMWRGFKKVLAARLPKASPKGLLMYGMTRSTQIRRFRSPAPRIKRGKPIDCCRTAMSPAPLPVVASRPGDQQCRSCWTEAVAGDNGWDRLRTW